MANNPISFNDPNGDFIHIAIGAAVGGVINLAVQGAKGNIGSFGDGLAAFGIGAVAGGVTAATGGAAAGALGLGTTGIASGVATGGIGAIAGSPIQGIGNAVAFGDEYSLKQWGTDILIGGVAGGVISGAIAGFKGQNLWWGNTVRPSVPSANFNPGSPGSNKVDPRYANSAKAGGTPAFDVDVNAFNKSASFGVDDWVQVRHHTSGVGLKGIRTSGSIFASRGKPYGVDVEIAPFYNPSKVNLGQFGKGSFVEFSVPRANLSPIPGGFMGGTGNAGRIITGGAPLNITKLSPRYVRWNWLGF